MTETGREFQILGTIITGCSSTIVVNLAIRYKKIDRSNGGNNLFLLIIKHEFGDFKRIDLENI